MRVQLALAFGALAGALAVALSLVIGHYASEAARAEIGHSLARLAVEYRDRLDVGAAVAPGARFDLARAERLRVEIEADAPASGPFELMLVQGDGTVIVGPPALLGKKVPMPVGVRVGAPVAIEHWPDGDHFLAGGRASRGIGAGLDLAWVSIARKHQDVAFAPVVRLQHAILWAGLALALAAIGVGWLLAARLARPLEALAAAAGEISADTQRAALPRLTDNLEVARLSDALRAMLSHLREQAEALREAQDRMEHRVRERTAELIELQAQLELEIADTMLARDDVFKANERLAFALDTASLALWDCDVESDSVYLGAGWSQMLGGAAVETRTTTRELLTLVPEEQRARVAEALNATLTGAVSEYRVEHPVRRPDGGLIWIASLGRVVERGADGRARRLVGTNRDITELVEAKRVRDALRSATARDQDVVQLEKRR